MKLKITSPIKALIKEATPSELLELRSLLTYTNTSNQHLLKRHAFNHRWKQSNFEAWQARNVEIQNTVRNTLIFKDEDGAYIRPASIPYLKGKLSIEVENEVKYPSPKKIPWAKPLPFTLHDYQEESAIKLIEEKHGNVELVTGSGKSAILLKICRETGFKSLIVVPSKSIFEELVDKFEYHFGKGKIGKFGNGKKSIGKQITIAIGDSISNIKPDTEEWKFFSSLQLVQFDESHTLGADTLESICNGILGSIPYRIFTSGTQTRGDGSEKLLQSIIGKTVHELSAKEAVEKGYIAKHEFRIVSVESSNPNFMVADALSMKREHFLKNKNIAIFVSKLAKVSATKRQQVLVLVEELSQIAMLLPLLRADNIPTAIAHSETKPERLKELGLEKVDNKESVEKFNKAEVLVLVGTSAIATGTNIFPTHWTVNWVGGASLIKTLQGSVGRSVRLHDQNPHKDLCVIKERAIIFDFDVEDIHVLSKHLEDRMSYYKKSDAPIKYVRIK